MEKGRLFMVRFHSRLSCIPWQIQGWRNREEGGQLEAGARQSLEEKFNNCAILPNLSRLKWQTKIKVHTKIKLNDGLHQNNKILFFPCYTFSTDGRLTLLKKNLINSHNSDMVAV
jgi:hypothetical protein